MKSDAAFLRDFATSHQITMAVAMWLREMGRDVRIIVPTVRPDSSRRKQHADYSGDIEIIRKIEVKQRLIDFTSEASYPYPTIFIGETYKIDAALGNLCAIVVTNRAVTHAAYIPVGTRRHWIVCNVWDAEQGRDCKSYGCPKELAQFVQLNIHAAEDGP